MTSDQIIANLKQHANTQAVEGMARFGIRPAQALGISIPTLRKMAKEIGQHSGAPGHRGRLCHSEVGRLLTHMIPPLDADDIAKSTIGPHCYRQKQTRVANGSTQGSLASK